MKIILLTILLMLTGIHCAKKGALTTWKASQVPQVYRKILVVGVIHDTDLRFRSQIERHLAGELNRIGYEAASALAAYGAGGLAHMDEEATYITLYNRGYDALLTIALIDKHKEAAYKPEKIQSHSSLYFYNRIWSYKVIKADLLTKKPGAADAGSFRWESIFFDLKTLTPLYVLQTKSFEPFTTESSAPAYGNWVIAQMLKHKIITRKARPDERQLKPF